jgi:hypothetical protein
MTPDWPGGCCKQQPPEFAYLRPHKSVREKPSIATAKFFPIDGAK